jgi:tetratricopeptide (TPR) repeat protein
VVGKLVEGTTASDPTHVRLRPDEAERLRQLAGDEKTQSGALAEKGWAAYERGDVETAVVAFEEAAKAPDVRPWVLYALGLSRAALANPGGAAAAWERVREAAPGFSAVYIDLADAYLQLSESAKALEVLREGSRRWPADPEFHNAIGVIHVRRGALDEGIAAFTRAAGAAPEEPLAYFNLGRAYQMRHARDTRYVASQRRWISPENDRRQAIEHYKRYLQLGGPYSTQATEAISMLEWAKR